ncbi:MAG: cell envelope biogenesis protein TolA [Candidatus Pelagibacter sp. TMED273]|nr:MAG: cell envelope biogenesis protein TolA [Candidatus Pelagibacter sp. TMED273]
MIKNIFISSSFHVLIIILATLSLPFLAKKPIDLPPIISVELIQITDKTNIPFAPKAKKIIEKIKEKEKLVSEQAPPKIVKKEKPDSIPLPDDKIKDVKKPEEKKQNPEKIDTEIKQTSEFEKKELFDPNSIAALIDKSKEQVAETNKKNSKISQNQDKNVDSLGLTLSEEDALKAQIFGCWSIPLGLPYNENLLVRIKLNLKPDGTVIKSEILDHARMNKPGQGFYKVLAESALRAIRLCQPLRVPSTGYERWKELQLNFDAREMLEG